MPDFAIHQMRNDVFLKSAKKSYDARCSPSLLPSRLISLKLHNSSFSCSMPNHGISLLEYISHFQEANSGEKLEIRAALLHSSAALVCDAKHLPHPSRCGQKTHWEAHVLAFSGYSFHPISAGMQTSVSR